MAKHAVFSCLALIGITGVGFLLYVADQDFFWGFFWFLIIASFLKIASQKMSAQKSKTALHITAAAIGLLWLAANSAAFELVAKNINTNPYGEYFVSQFQFRLALSVFILKIISKAWITDGRLVIISLLFLANYFTFPAIFKFLSSRLSPRSFEFFVHTCKNIQTDLVSYLASRFALFVLNSFLWCLAAFFLRFDNFVILTVIMAICAFTPRLGLFLAAALSIVYVESGLFMLQLGGIFIATASVWFVGYTLFRDWTHPCPKLYVVLLLLLLPIGYVLLSFPGLFVVAPAIIFSFAVGARMTENLPLIHKI